MSHAWNEQLDGDKVTGAKFNEATLKLGRITGVGLYNMGLGDYLIGQVGSLYYRRDRSGEWNLSHDSLEVLTQACVDTLEAGTGGVIVLNGLQLPAGVTHDETITIIELRGTVSRIHQSVGAYLPFPVLATRPGLAGSQWGFYARLDTGNLELYNGSAFQVLGTGSVNASSILGKAVDDAAIADSKALVYKALSGKIEYEDIPSDATKIRGTNVNPAAIGDGKSLVYRVASGEIGYEAVGGGAGDATSIRGRTVTVAAPNEGDVMKWRSGPAQWEYESDLGAGGDSVATQAASFVTEVLGSSPNYKAHKKDGTVPYTSDDFNDLINDICLGEGNPWSMEVPCGTVKGYTPLTFGHETGFTLRGQGYGTVWEVAANLGVGNDFINYTSDDWNQGRFLIEGFCIDGKRATYTSRDLIHIAGSDWFELHNLFLHHSYRDCIYTENGSPSVTYGHADKIYAKYAGRYGVYWGARDCFLSRITTESTEDSGFVLAGDGNTLDHLHTTYAHYNHGGVGGGNDRYAGLEILGGANHIDLWYLDRCNKYGAYIVGNHNQMGNGRVYECNYPNIAPGYADIYVGPSVTYYKLTLGYLKGRSSNPTNYGVDDDQGGDYNCYDNNDATAHAIGARVISGAHSKDSSINQWIG